MIAASSTERDANACGGIFRAMPLRRLNESEAFRLVARHAPDLDRARRVWVVSTAVGNPLALLELAATAASVDVTRIDAVRSVWTLPPALRRAFAGPGPAFPEPTRAAVLVAAIDPDCSLQEILAATALFSGHPVTAAVLEIPEAAGLLHLDETRVHFSHPLVQAVIVQDESVSRRQAAHRALGAVASLSSSRRAWHRALGTPAHDDAVAAQMEETSRTSIARGDMNAAVAALERAAQLSGAPLERGRRLVLAAHHAARLGQPDRVARLLRAAAAGQLSDFDQLRVQLLDEDFNGTVMDESARVIHLCRTSSRAAAAGETGLALEFAAAAARRRYVAPLDAVALSQLTSLAQGLARTSPGASTIALLALADPVGNGRHVLSALSDTDETARLPGDELSAFGVAAHSVGHYRTASRLFDRAEVALRAHGLLGPLARNLSIAAELRVELGEWDRAAAALAGFAPLAAACMSRSHRASALLTAAKMAALRGDESTAIALVAQAEHSDTARSGSGFLARAHLVRGLAAISAGRHTEAYAALIRCFDPQDPSHHHREKFDAVAYLAETAAHTGRQEQVRQVIQRMRRVWNVSGSPALLTQLSYAEAVLAPEQTAEHSFRTALTSNPIGSPWHHARIQLAYGRWLRRQYRVTQSRDPLRQSLAVFRRLGAVRWATEAFDELAATGISAAPVPDKPGTSLLSPQELKIAHFAAQGLSNREIAQRLYLSPRTVSSHLYRMFPKLGISARGQLALRLAGERAEATALADPSR